MCTYSEVDHMLTQMHCAYMIDLYWTSCRDIESVTHSFYYAILVAEISLLQTEKYYDCGIFLVLLLLLIIMYACVHSLMQVLSRLEEILKQMNPQTEH